MFCSTGEVIFIHLDQMDKTCPSTLILASSQGLLHGQIRGDIRSIQPELALYGSNNRCARTDTVLLPISQVCTRGVTLTVSATIHTVPTMLLTVRQKVGSPCLQVAHNVGIFSHRTVEQQNSRTIEQYNTRISEDQKSRKSRIIEQFNHRTIKQQNSRTVEQQNGRKV